MPARRDELRPGAAAAFALLLALVLASPVHAANFVGAASCRVCHEAAYEQWRSSPHARALEALPSDGQKDPRCLVCHARDAALGGEAGVTCETCHGAGQNYWPSYVMRDAEVAKGAGLVAAPDAKACLLCHDASSPSLKSFDPAVAMPAIDHWSKERAARPKKSAQSCPRRQGGRAGDAQPAVEQGFLAKVLTGRWPGSRSDRAAGNTSGPARVASTTALQANGRASLATTRRPD